MNSNSNKDFFVSAMPSALGATFGADSFIDNACPKAV